MAKKTASGKAPARKGRGLRAADYFAEIAQSVERIKRQSEELALLFKPFSSLEAVAVAWRRRLEANEPHTTAAIRLCELLEQAKADPKIAASGNVVDFLQVVLMLVEDATFTNGADEAFAPLAHLFNADRIKSAQRKAIKRRKEASKMLEARVLELARVDTKRGRGKRIALELGITESTVSEILKAKNLR